MRLIIAGLLCAVIFAQAPEVSVLTAQEVSAVQMAQQRLKRAQDEFNSADNQLKLLEDQIKHSHFSDFNGLDVTAAFSSDGKFVVKTTDKWYSFRSQPR